MVRQGVPASGTGGAPGGGGKGTEVQGPHGHAKGVMAQVGWKEERFANQDAGDLMAGGHLRGPRREGGDWTESPPSATAEVWEKTCSEPRL